MAHLAAELKAFMQTACITGIAGFAASHLADLLLGHQWRVIGLASPQGNRSNIAHLGNHIEVIGCDIRDRDAVHKAISKARPDVIFHLAAKTIEQETRTDPRTAFDVTVLGTIHLLDAATSVGPNKIRVHVAGSSAEYGRVEEPENPINESQPFRPVGMYGVTKISQSMAGLQFHLAGKIPVIRTRAFNHTGPRQAQHFATSAFAKQIAEIEAGILPPLLKVGDLSQRRDLSDVRDVVRGYFLAATQGVSGEVYNIASGWSVQTQEVLDRLIAMSRVKIEVAIDPERLRPTEVAVQVGDSSKLRELTGWQPEIPMQQTLSDTLEYWRKIISLQTTRSN
jgi:GDP-4-dehydro-6-deoxy-D-mannose reductase